MKCEDILAGLNDYVDGETASVLCQEFQKHLAGCNPCQLVVDNIRRTVTLYREGRPIELPPELKQRLCAILRAKWEEKFHTSHDGA
ncbi:MAG: anti-sigma factor family protein [Planctomycetota bacterium]